MEIFKIVSKWFYEMGLENVCFLSAGGCIFLIAVEIALRIRRIR